MNTEEKHAQGILRMSRQGTGVLYDPALGVEGLRVPERLLQAYALVEGAALVGAADAAGRELATLTQVCGQAPERFRQRTPFEELVAIAPHARFDFSALEDRGLRLIDLIAPIGRGTRGLIVAPPKAGKTLLLEQLAKGIRAVEPEARIIVLLIDERPEEVTYFRRHAQAEVYASSSDQRVDDHLALAELMLAHIRTELECGNEVVVLIDSLTRLVRAINRRGGGPGRTLSGGLEASALEFPRRFFGLARAIEGGGSVTLLATLLVDTGSRMDQVIYEEFKSTGNCELVLRRDLAEARLYPAIDVHASSTRAEEKLLDPEDLPRIQKLRRVLANRPPQSALRQLLELLGEYPNNREFLEVIK